MTLLFEHLLQCQRGNFSTSSSNQSLGFLFLHWKIIPYPFVVPRGQYVSSSLFHKSTCFVPTHENRNHQIIPYSKQVNKIQVEAICRNQRYDDFAPTIHFDLNGCFEVPRVFLCYGAKRLWNLTVY